MNSQGAQTVAEGGRLPSSVTWLYRGWGQIKSGALFPGAIRQSYMAMTMNHIVQVQYQNVLGVPVTANSSVFSCLCGEIGHETFCVTVISLQVKWCFSA